MALKPVLTEKSLNEAKNGKYTFLVGVGLTKYEIKELVEGAFKVHVKSVHVIKKGSELKKTYSKGIRFMLPSKKAVVTLAEKEKIDLFEEIKG